ncbi:hypothetical protein BpHYR1_007398 [Brachionus plicatilis]|uniref:Uncharacterized protein n=1 Tax=Brachionus plicatilis TaxID=10195 RepID=A0A3M7SRV2_BRAPC|nr:hypothetical protein BpHYR1_007398 [Brachionus plicatilis]
MNINNSERFKNGLLVRKKKIGVLITEIYTTNLKIQNKGFYTALIKKLIFALKKNITQKKKFECIIKVDFKFFSNYYNKEQQNRSSVQFIQAQHS